MNAIGAAAPCVHRPAPKASRIVVVPTAAATNRKRRYVRQAPSTLNQAMKRTGRRHYEVAPGVLGLEEPSLTTAGALAIPNSLTNRRADAVLTGTRVHRAVQSILLDYAARCPTIREFSDMCKLADDHTIRAIGTATETVWRDKKRTTGDSIYTAKAEFMTRISRGRIDFIVHCAADQYLIVFEIKTSPTGIPVALPAAWLNQMCHYISMLVEVGRTTGSATTAHRIYACFVIVTIPLTWLAWSHRSGTLTPIATNFSLLRQFTIRPDVMANRRSFTS